MRCGDEVQGVLVERTVYLLISIKEIERKSRILLQVLCQSHVQDPAYFGLPTACRADEQYERQQSPLVGFRYDINAPDEPVQYFKKTFDLILTIPEERVIPQLAGFFKASRDYPVKP